MELGQQSQKMTSKKLLYVTLAYPGDLYSEKVFVDSELQALRREFDEIVLVPTDRFPRSANYERSLPEGVTADWALASDKVYSSKILKLPYIFHLDVIRAIWGMRREARSPRKWLKGLFQAINMVRSSIIISRVARRHNMSPRNTVLYSMWFADPAAGLARLALRDKWKMATRAHTSDLYDDRMLFRSRTLRSRLLRGVSKVFTISAKGAEYMKARYPEAAGRIAHHPLGALRTGPRDNSRQYLSENAVSFVTTARLDPVKSLSLIMDTLEEIARKRPDLKVSWTLFGDGPCLEDLVDQAARSNTPNFKVKFKGALPNDQIQHFYATERPDWFIMMSRSEGLPISMGEAMAHAIPIITTEVGDVTELVGPDCAILLPPPCDPDSNPGMPRSKESAPFSDSSAGYVHSPREYAELISAGIADPTLHDTMAQAAATRWAATFDASRLATRTASFLSSLIN